MSRIFWTCPWREGNWLLSSMWFEEEWETQVEEERQEEATCVDSSLCSLLLLFLRTLWLWWRRCCCWMRAEAGIVIEIEEVLWGQFWEEFCETGKGLMNRVVVGVCWAGHVVAVILSKGFLSCQSSTEWEAKRTGQEEQEFESVWVLWNSDVILIIISHCLHINRMTMTNSVIVIQGYKWLLHGMKDSLLEEKLFESYCCCWTILSEVGQPWIRREEIDYRDHD